MSAFAKGERDSQGAMTMLRILYPQWNILSLLGCALSDKPILRSDRHCVRHGERLQLGPDIGGVHVGGSPGEREVLGDLAWAQTFGKPRQDIAFARCKRLNSGGRWGAPGDGRTNAASRKAPTSSTFWRSLTA